MHTAYPDLSTWTRCADPGSWTPPHQTWAAGLPVVRGDGQRQVRAWRFNCPPWQTWACPWPGRCKPSRGPARWWRPPRRPGSARRWRWGARWGNLGDVLDLVVALAPDPATRVDDHTGHLEHRGVYFLGSADKVVRNRTRAVRKSWEILFYDWKADQIFWNTGGGCRWREKYEVSKPKN